MFRVPRSWIIKVAVLSMVTLLKLPVLRPLLIIYCPPPDELSTPPEIVLVPLIVKFENPSAMVPPLLKVAPDIVKLPLSVESPATVNVPLNRLIEPPLPRTRVFALPPPVMVILKLPMVTSSMRVGTATRSQLFISFQLTPSPKPVQVKRLLTGARIRSTVVAPIVGGVLKTGSITRESKVLLTASIVPPPKILSAVIFPGGIPASNTTSSVPPRLAALAEMLLITNWS